MISFWGMDIYRHTHTHAHTHTHKRMDIYRDTHTPTHTQAHTHTNIRARARMRAHTQVHAHTCTRAHTPSCTHAHSHTHARACVHTYTPPTHTHNVESNLIYQSMDLLYFCGLSIVFIIFIFYAWLLVVCFQVGSGKSSLLNSILGEMHLIHGVIQSRGSLAYVPQVILAFLVQMKL